MKLPSSVLLLAALLLLCASARADESPVPLPPPALPHIPLSVTVGGGVSLGAYQAGFLYYMSESAKKNASALDLKLVSGASAGSINALLTVLAACSKAQENPEDNLFWSIWHDVGFDQLFLGGAEESADAALSNAALASAAERLRGAWIKGITPYCDVVFAVTATRVADTPAIAGGSLSAPRLAEKFVLRIKGRGAGLAPEIHNYVDPAAPTEQVLLALPRDQSTPTGIQAAFDRVKEVLLASAAFPVAFPPVAVRVCALQPGEAPPAGGPTECAGREREVPFLDGGVYDNTPLRLAYHVARRLTPGGARWTWSDAAAPRSAEPPAAAVFTLIDKDNAGYPDAPDDYEEQSATGASRSLLSYLANFAGGFVNTTMAGEVAALAEEAPGFTPRVLSSVRHYPTASGYLANFFGFFEHDLRRFDFYLGMYDALRMAQDHLETLTPAARAGLIEPAAASAPALRCMIAAYADQPVAESACRGPELHAFRILLQVSLDRLYSQCQRLAQNPEARTTKHALCRQAMALRPGEPRRLVVGVERAAGARWRQDRGETSLSHMMRLLAHYQFPFADLGLDGAHADGAMAKIRHRLGRMVEALSVRQSAGDRALISVAGKVGLNVLHYAPPFAIVYAELGRGYELGTSLIAIRFRDSTSLRWNLAVEGKGLDSLLDAAEHRGPLALAWAPVTGPELEIHGDAVAQFRLAVRGGFQVSTNGWGTAADFARSSSGGHAPLLQVVPSIALFERLRVQVAYEQLLPTKATHEPGWDLLAGLGWQWLSPFY